MRDLTKAEIVQRVVDAVEALQPNEAIALPGESIAARTASGTLRFAHGWFDPHWWRCADGLTMVREHVEMLLTGNPYDVRYNVRELSIPSTLRPGRCENVGRRNFHFVRTDSATSRKERNDA